MFEISLYAKNLPELLYQEKKVIICDWCHRKHQFPVLASVHYICITSDYLRSKELSISSIKVSHSFDFVPEFVHLLDSLFF